MLAHALYAELVEHGVFAEEFASVFECSEFGEGCVERVGLPGQFALELSDEVLQFMRFHCGLRSVMVIGVSACVLI